MAKKRMIQGIILNEQDLKEAVSYFLQQDCFIFDIESAYDNRLDPNRNTVTWISLATYGCCIVIPMGHDKGEYEGKQKVPAQYGGTGPRAGKWYNKTVDIFSDPPVQLDAGTVFDCLRPLFQAPEIVKGGHDVLFDIISISKYLGFVPVGPYFCTKTGDWLLDENRWTHGLKERIEEEYGFIWDTENIGKCVEDHPFSRVAYYSYCDSKMDFLWMLRIKAALDKENLTKVFKLEMNVLNVLIGMRMEGIKIDIPRLKELKEKLSAELLISESAIYKAAGKKFNINSNPQKQEILYLPRSKGGQGLKPWKLTDAGKKAKKLGVELTIYHYSTDDDVMASYPDNPVCAAIREYGDIYKVLNTYVEGWLTAQVDGKLHAGILQYGTVTGRFSCRKPNLQNIPRSSSELGMLVRSVFISDEGYKLICADYSQIELVILAHYIGEGKLYEGFLAGIDPHLMTAAMVLGREPFISKEEGDGGVTKVERQDLGKTLGFAVVYGAGLGKVASMAHIDWEEAKRVLKKHAEMFPEVHNFKQNVIDLARSRKPVPYITTLLGRKRRVPDLNSPVEGIRMGAERQLFNSLIQGGATGDLMKLALIRIDVMLPEGCKLLLTVHDEILVLAPDHLVDKAIEVVYDAMTGPGIQKLVKVPLKIDLHVGSSWGDIK
jgi:DNA polymerase I-like protein with 3'-5' exonuclease and polymerase domains